MKPTPRFHLLRIALLGVPLLLSHQHTLAAVDPASPEAEAVEKAQRAKAAPDESKGRKVRDEREQAEKAADAAKLEAAKLEAAKLESVKLETAKLEADIRAAAEKEKSEKAETPEKRAEKADNASEADREENRRQAREERQPNARKTPPAKDTAAEGKMDTEERNAVEPPARPNRSDRRAIPTIPAIPNAPATPEVPATPGAPRVPAIPGAPAVPTVPNTPATPTVPGVPAIPATPGANASPGARANPPDRPITPPATAAIPPTPATAPERQAETQVREATREVERDLSERKTKIRSKDEAQAVIDQVLGTESRISRAEILREERVRPGIDAADRQRRGPERGAEISPAQRREAVEYFQQRLRGERIDAQPPAMLLRSDSRRETRVERTEYVGPRYLSEGRRYVHYNSRASIPAILLAAEALNRVRIMPAREVAPVLYENRETTTLQAELPPQNYRDENAFVVSYPVNEKSMISSGDILFQQGSTQFADPYSYEIVSTLGDAMKNLPDGERFAIEGHASAEGSYEDNMVLSQQRAERIVREMVRHGVSPQRLIPVGYGESEARHPAETAEAQRQQDRRVVVFRLNDEPLAKR